MTSAASAISLLRRKLARFAQLTASAAALAWAAQAAHAEAPIAALPPLSATSFILLDAATGETIAEHEADLRLPPASLTKLMTSYALAEHLHLGSHSEDDMVRISRNAWSQNPVFRGSSLMFIEHRQKVRLGDLHLGVVVSSGNDASVAIAEHISGSEQEFVTHMNQLAQRIGMTNTHFANAHGLTTTQHYTTARDMAILARAYIRDFPEHYKLYRNKEFTFNGIRQYNRNRLLWNVPYVDGLKTGHTKEAGYCLVASGEKEGMRLITVTFNSSSERARTRDNLRLLSYGFHYYTTYRPYAQGEALREIRVWGGTQTTVNLSAVLPIELTLAKNQVPKIEFNYAIEDPVLAPVEQANTYGDLTLTLDGEALAQVELAPTQSVAKEKFIPHTMDMVRLVFYRLLR